LATTLTTVDIAKWQADSDIDWAALKAGGVTSVIIQLSHGHSQEEEAAAHIASAEKYGIIWHGYHFYEGTAGEVEFSTSNAQSMGLKSGAYMFLDMEGDFGGDWQQQFYDFRTVWLAAGWKTGVYISDSPYTAKFDDAELTADGVYRWIAAYSYEPANYDIWQYSSTGGVPGYSKDIDKDYDRSGKLSQDYTAVKTDPYNPPNPVAGAHVGVGVDTTGLAGGQAYGYSTNGSDFYTALSPYGFIFRQRDADRMWPLLKPKIGTIQGAKGDKGDTGPAGKDGIQGPKGDTGPAGVNGKDGAAATIAVGTVTTGAAGTNASVTNAGTANAAKLDFTIPQGAKGDKGDTGAQGIQGPKGDTGATGAKGDPGTNGTNGAAGATGPAGAPGLNVWVYKYDRGASRAGSYWSDLTPAPSTSNPPKVGDTVIDIPGNVYQVTKVVVGGGGGGGTFDYGPVISNIKGPTGPKGDGIRVRDDGDANKGQNWGRAATPMPDWYLQNAPAQTVKEFKNWAAIGSPALSNGDKPNYAVVETTVPGANSGYGFARQVAWPTTTSGVPITLVRMGTSATAWTAWKEVTYW
jgi:GH25 family lysozyme M1 (1,4-beta-N-acetylmuramidase)